ncbi:RNA methyltransferase, TrmA family [hydrothermal vent metagenome]|uniref:RNA methyltransferase, TrmA family n=1 Tax=hydrothermal vent metagenome TaxID=652676 RepID=A0A1W1B8E9_9ZZZZ
MKDSKEYLEKKAKFERVITLYGRQTVKEILQDHSIPVEKLHLAKSNKPDGSIKKIMLLAKERGIETIYHEKAALSRISKNAKQDQGVAIDILSPTYQNAKEIAKLKDFRLIALDGIQNPQNLGMIIRSCAAGNVDGIILPKRNSAKISPLVAKASAGTLFKIPIYFCDALAPTLKEIEADKYLLSSHAKESIYDLKEKSRSIFVLGNESEGVSKEVAKECNKALAIPLNRGVESLNVAVTAALIAFMRT